MGSVRTELARHVLEMLAHGHPVSIHEAFQLRNRAGRPENLMLSLEEVAHRILNQEENPNARGAEPAWSAKRKPDLSRNIIGPLNRQEHAAEDASGRSRSARALVHPVRLERLRLARVVTGPAQRVPPVGLHALYQAETSIL